MTTKDYLVVMEPVSVKSYHAGMDFCAVVTQPACVFQSERFHPRGQGEDRMFAWIALKPQLEVVLCQNLI